jgi:hypothetical protein
MLRTKMARTCRLLILMSRWYYGKHGLDERSHLTLFGLSLSLEQRTRKKKAAARESFIHYTILSGTLFFDGLERNWSVNGSSNLDLSIERRMWKISSIVAVAALHF